LDGLKGGREMKHTEIPNEASKLLNTLNDAQKKALGGILDTGHRTEFETGAVRDAAPGRGRCDLLPLDVIENWLEDGIFDDINNYIRTGKVEWLYTALDGFIDAAFPDTYTAILETAIQYEDGAKKYNERNWERGIPLHCYIDSAVRHYLKWLRGDDDEHHDRAVVWNLLCAAWTHKHKPDMIDLPFAEGAKK
jgi:hypothetical protein